MGNYPRWDCIWIDERCFKCAYKHRVVESPRQPVCPKDLKPKWRFLWNEKTECCGNCYKYYLCGKQIVDRHCDSCILNPNLGIYFQPASETDRKNSDFLWADD